MLTIWGLAAVVNPHDRALSVHEIEQRNPKTLYFWIAGLINAIVLLFGFFAIRREQQKQKVEQELRQSDQLNRTILETTQDGVSMVDLQGRLLSVNEAYCQMTGYSRQELVGMQVNQIDANEEPTETQARIARIIQNGSERFEVRQQRKDGTMFAAEVTATYVPGEPPRLVCFCRDISEKKQAFAELQQAKQTSEEHETRYKALHDASFGGILIHDQGVILDANQGLTKMTGYSLPELIGLDGLQLIAPDSREWVQSRITSNYEKPYAAMGLRKSGESYPLRIDGRAIPYKGKMVRVTEFRDITEQRELELRFLAAHERLKTVLDSMDELVYIADMETHELLFANAYGLKIWGEDSIGKPCYSVLQRRERPCPFCTNDKLVNADGTASGIYRWEFQNNTNNRWYDISDQAIQWLDGRLVRMEIAKDISDRKQLETDLRQSEVRYRTVTMQAFDAVVIVDPVTLTIVETNPAFDEMTGYRAEERLHVYDLFDDQTINILRFLDEVHETGSLRPTLRRVKTRDGRVVLAERTGRLVQVGSENLLIITLRDVTQEKIKQQELKSQLMLAAQVQRALLPAVPRAEAFKIETLFEPHGYVSGDYYHLEWLAIEQKLRGFLLDVTGHGMATALQTAAVNVLLHESHVLPAELTLEKRLEWLNSKIPQYLDENSFVAAIAFEIDFASAQLHFAAAGIKEFLLNGRRISAPGLFLGINPEECYELCSMPINDGDVICFMTDGISDVLDSEGAWGRIEAKTVCKLFREEHYNDKLKDDATVVCIRIRQLAGKTH